jgi:hypothetical protein
MSVLRLEDLKRSLPNFPDEVLANWLLPFANVEGWPPARDDESLPEKRWIFLLDGRPLRYWRSLSWSPVERHVSVNDLGTESRAIMIHIVLGAVAEQRNSYTDAIHNLRPRFWRVVEHIWHNGRLPKPPTLLVASDGLSILDGNHRMAAYLYCYGYFKLDPGPELQLKTEAVQRYWIASDPTTNRWSCRETVDGAFGRCLGGILNLDTNGPSDLVKGHDGGDAPDLDRDER